ncbi:MAG TPA: aminotransferase class V-fold PLP-dependent enzyme [Alphaproteobacteria bacterium]|nr:aminotransferase class V-fold PLP-dependent enzyme [Alphaproteobacteria bacterium]
MDNDTKSALERAQAHAARYLDSLAERRVGPALDFEALMATLDGPLPATGEDPAAVIDALAAAAEPGLVASTGPRYFGFVTGGSLPAALAANWLVDAWDQNGALNIMSPGTAAIEAVAGRWFKEAIGLPDTATVGFTTGCTMANAAGIAAGRHALLARAGWDVEADGLFGAPEIDVVVGDEVHSSVSGTLQLLGLGRERVIRIPADGQGRMEPGALHAALAGGTKPALVCAQLGNVNTGACDDMEAIADACEAAGAWLHVDGAFGLWAAASPQLSHLVAGVERADSWATDAHKWLNVPYDGGIVAVRDAAAHRATMTQSGAYLIRAGSAPDGMEYVPDASRRVRGVPVYAALRALGRDGLAALIEGNCARARQFAARMEAEDAIEVLNKVALNQVLVRFVGGGSPAADDALTNQVIAAVQADGTAWFGGTVWQGKAAMRVSVSNWRTGEADIDRAADAVIACYRERL